MLAGSTFGEKITRGCILFAKATHAWLVSYSESRQPREKVMTNTLKQTTVTNTLTHARAQRRPDMLLFIPFTLLSITCVPYHTAERPSNWMGTLSCLSTPLAGNWSNDEVDGAFSSDMLAVWLDGDGSEVFRWQVRALERRPSCSVRHFLARVANNT